MATATKPVNHSTATTQISKPRATGFIIWQGESRIDGSPIALIATRAIKNPKIGTMVQTWILRTDIDPITAVQTGADSAVCGGCIHRGFLEWLTKSPVKNRARRDAVVAELHRRSCYVHVGQAPRSIYAAYRRGRYPVATDADLAQLLAGQHVRFGAYGDPVAVPIDILNLVRSHAIGHTGYTHLWRNGFADAYRHLLMASCDSSAGRTEAKASGWRTFRVRLESQPILPGEITCPASNEAKLDRKARGLRPVTCHDCRACDGWTRAGQVDVVLIAHGKKTHMNSIRANLASLG